MLMSRLIPEELIKIKAEEIWKKRQSKGMKGTPENDWESARHYLENHQWGVFSWEFRKRFNKLKEFIERIAKKGIKTMNTQISEDGLGNTTSETPKKTSKPHASPPAEMKKWRALSSSISFAAIALIACHGLAWWFSESRSQRWGYNLRYYESLSQEKNNSPTSYKEFNNSIVEYLDEYTDSKAQKTRIIEQLTTISNRAKTHLRVAKDLYIWSISILFTSVLSSVVAGLCLLHITRHGWNNASLHVVGVFVASSGVLVTTTSLPLLFRYEQNIKTNTQLYVNYVNLEDQVLAILSAKKFVDAQLSRPLASNNEEQMESKQDEVTLDKIIISTHNSMQQLHTISYEIDLRGIPTLEEITKQLDVSQ